MKLFMTSKLQERCRLARGERSFGDIARRAGLARAHPRHIECGIIADPSAVTLERLAKGYGVRAEWLILGDGPMTDIATELTPATERVPQ